MTTSHAGRGSHGSPLTALDAAPVWIGSEPLTAGGLRGSVVLVDFWTYSCVNWLRTLPYVRAWHERYRDRGLVVVGVHAPEFGFEHDLDNVRWAVQDLGVGFPVVLDNGYAVWRAFGNHWWPSTYVLDQDGRVRFHHAGEESYVEIEQAVQRLLGVDGAPVEVEATGLTAAADWPRVLSPETYVGDARAERRTAGPVDGLPLNRWTLVGDWAVGDEVAELRSGGGSIGCRFQARDLNLVLTPSAADAPVRYVVRLDGEPPGLDGGGDVDAAGEGVLSEPRMHQLVRQQAPDGPRLFEVTFLDPGARAYVFTFG